MKILYVTDLHGNKRGYEQVLERAERDGVRAIVNGGDMYPLGSDLFGVQREFLVDWLPDFLARCNDMGIAYAATLGNMDLRGLDDLFRRKMGEADEAYSLVDERCELEGYELIGSPMTTDGPFSLKDRCLRDTPDAGAPFADGRALLSDDDGIREVDDWESRVNGMPSLREHLDELPSPRDPERAVYVLHQPPAGAGLGIIDSGDDVGSAAVADFLRQSGALLSLHGHIHESPEAGGNWRAELGDTACVQPGQRSGSSVVSVTIDLGSLEMDRET